MDEELYTDMTQQDAEYSEEMFVDGLFNFADEFADVDFLTEEDVKSLKRMSKSRICALFRKLFKYTFNPLTYIELSTEQIHKVEFSQYHNTVPTLLSLFFGLCCSSPPYIFDAIFGSSSTRIFSI